MTIIGILYSFAFLFYALTFAFMFRITGLNLHLLTFLILIIITVFLFISLGQLKEVRRGFNIELLGRFSNKIKASYIVTLVSYFVFIMGYSLIFVDPSPFIFLLFALSIIINFVAKILEFQSWNHLQMFIKPNYEMFPPTIHKGAKTGAFKAAAVLDIFIILMIIGYILRIVGSFQLAKLRNLLEAPPVHEIATHHPIPPSIPPTPPASTPSSTNFCSNCGAALKSEARFCPECGSSVN